jgi:lysozyme
MINPAGRRLIRESESCKLTAYLCPAGVPTIGWGHIATVTKRDVEQGKTITQGEAEDLFRMDVEKTEYATGHVLIRRPNENQFAAMVSLAFNIGDGAFAKSTVCRAFNKGDDAAAAQAFGLWNKITVSGKKIISNGLVARRAKETALFLTPVEAGFPVPVSATMPSPMPQAVEPPVTMTASKINKSALLTGAGASIALATDVVGKINEFKLGFEKLGHWTVPLLLVAVIAFAGWTLYERIKQRQDGVA